MAEKDSKPTIEEPGQKPVHVHPIATRTTRHLLPLGLGLVALLTGCWWGAQPETTSTTQEILATPTIAVTSTNQRTEQANAALTRVASSLAQAPDPTLTPTPVAADSALIPLPTVTPTLVPSPVPTRTIEISGDATLRLQINTNNFESNGQPVTIQLDPRTYVLGGEAMSKTDQWCVQVGATGLVFDLILTMQPVTENLHVGGELQLYDGFCGTLGNLGNRLSTVPMNVVVPVGSAAQLAPALQVQGSLMGLENLLDISTGVFLDLTIRNPNPR